MTLSQFIFKVKFRLWGRLVDFSEKKWFYLYLYRSYWHYKFSANKSVKNTTCYYTARPNPGAGIGHQLANWLTGHWYANIFGLKFAHIPLTPNWEDFFELGKDEIKVEDLIKEGYKLRKLPSVNERNPHDLILNKAIIQSYAGKKLVLIAEQDQNTEDFGEIELLKQKYYQAKARNNERLLYRKDQFNIACHVRRGDIVGKKDDGMQMRWQNQDYFVNVLKSVLNNLDNRKSTSIYLFSQGEQQDFSEFEQFPNLHFCLDMNVRDSFSHLIYADLLITSKSSFSYKPALISNAVKVCPKSFWHGYPNTVKWVVADDNGAFDENQLKQALSN